MTYEPRYLGMSPSEFLPPVHLTLQDCSRLRALLRANGVQVAPQVRRFLLREIERATLYPSPEIPADVVTMHSRIVYRRHPGKPRETRILCYGIADALSGPTLSVLTPLGAALLGLRCGVLMPYETWRANASSRR
jgi:regulator of nucleoside diphosphate kinase